MTGEIDHGAADMPEEPFPLPIDELRIFGLGLSSLGTHVTLGKHGFNGSAFNQAEGYQYEFSPKAPIPEYIDQTSVLLGTQAGFDESDLQNGLSVLTRISTKPPFPRLSVYMAGLLADGSPMKVRTMERPDISRPNMFSERELLLDEAVIIGSLAVLTQTAYVASRKYEDHPELISGPLGSDLVDAGLSVIAVDGLFSKRLRVDAPLDSQGTASAVTHMGYYERLADTVFNATSADEALLASDPNYRRLRELANAGSYLGLVLDSIGMRNMPDDPNGL